ncbi:hypothetical protein CPB85DRAFT_1258242 [Mucidula mucida]|nr:hypothetical protein CPB85DRAFT_1258242 [Mucidula mucida]
MHVKLPLHWIEMEWDLFQAKLVEGTWRICPIGPSRRGTLLTASDDDEIFYGTTHQWNPLYFTLFLWLLGCCAELHPTPLRFMVSINSSGAPHCFKLGLLRLFHNLNCLGKLPAWDLWKALETMTKHCTSTPPPQRYKVLLRSIRQWRHLKLLKRAGRGHALTGVSGTAPGELVVACPACPHPNRNLPPNWESIFAERKFIYILFLAIDANFRLCNAVVSTTERDPPLGDGWAYFIEQAPYNVHIRTFVSQEDMISCSGFKATLLANLKDAKGLRTTGVAGVTCSRHGVWQPNGMGDLQRGERFCNVEPLVAISMAGDNLRLDLLPLQWCLNFDPNRVRFCVPKFHLWAHCILSLQKVQCHALFLFNFLVGAGRTHGETIKENWAQRARKDTLDDIFSAHNYRVVKVFGCVLLTCLAKAIREARTHAKEFNDFHAGMVTYCGDEDVKNWEREVLIWDRDHSQPCPYEPRLQNKETMKDIQLQLAQEEQMNLQSGSVSHESSMSLFLALGLKIEEKQRGLAWEIKRKVLDALASMLSEETKLFFPSELCTADRELPCACVAGLVHAETRLCEAECRDALKSLRQGLCIRSAGHLFTVRNVTGQNPTTRAEGVQRKVQVSVYLNKLCYRWARNALFRLCKHRSWERELCVLNASDVRGMNKRLLIAKEVADRRALAERGLIDELINCPSSENAVVSQGEGRRQLSWIWYSYAKPVDSLSVATRNDQPIEWCKEEVALLLEEMCRVIAYRRWNQDGLFAFAAEQGSRQDRVADDLESHWQGIQALSQELLDGLPVSRVVEVELDPKEEEDGGDENGDLDHALALVCNTPVPIRKLAGSESRSRPELHWTRGPNACTKSRCGIREGVGPLRSLQMQLRLGTVQIYGGRERLHPDMDIDVYFKPALIEIWGGRPQYAGGGRQDPDMDVPVNSGDYPVTYCYMPQVFLSSVYWPECVAGALNPPAAAETLINVKVSINFSDPNAIAAEHGAKLVGWPKEAPFKRPAELRKNQLICVYAVVLNNKCWWVWMSKEDQSLLQRERATKEKGKQKEKEQKAKGRKQKKKGKKFDETEEEEDDNNPVGHNASNEDNDNNGGAHEEHKVEWCPRPMPRQTTKRKWSAPDAAAAGESGSEDDNEAPVQQKRCVTKRRAVSSKVVDSANNDSE